MKRQQKSEEKFQTNFKIIISTLKLRVFLYTYIYIYILIGDTIHGEEITLS